MAIPASNLIANCLEKSLDAEHYAKFQQVLEHLGEEYYVPLYMSYNQNLYLQTHTLIEHKSEFPPGYSISEHITLKTFFFSFKFIKNVGKFIREKSDGNEKSEANFLTLLKILLFHGLTARTVSANFALVELEELCKEHKTTLQSLYHKYRAKFLRLIIKAVLYKLMNSSESDLNNSNGTNRPSNRAIIYMTRALEVFNVATINRDDVAKSLIIITNLIHKEKYNDAIKQFLNYLAIFQNIDLSTLIGSHIQAIIVSLLIRRKLSTYDITASLNKLCSFCDKTPSELLATKFTTIKALLLLNYHCNPKNVADSIYYLTKFELKESARPFEDEFDEEKHFIDYLDPSMIGILLGFDSHFTSNKKNLGSDESIEQIKSLGKLLSLLNEAQVRTIHVKLLVTLSSLLRIRPVRNNQGLNKVIIELWSIFLSKLGKDLRISLIINICVALYDLIEDSPEEAADIYYDLICKRNQSQSLAAELKSLFFIPDTPAMSRIYAYLTPYVRRQNSVSTLKELQESLDCALPLMKLENQRSRLFAISKIKELLHSNRNLIMSNMLNNSDEPLDDILLKTIESLISLSSTQDPECSALIAECLGILGAVNPIRMDHLIYGEISRDSFFGVAHLSDPKFIVDLIERLKSSLFSDQKSESETANYALQVVVNKFSIFSDQKIVSKLSEGAKKACLICKNTCYGGNKNAQPDLTLPVFEKFKLDNQYSYKEWLDKFALNIISIIVDEKIQEVLYACSYIFKYNLKLAEHLLSHAMIHIIIHQEPPEVSLIRREVLAIVDEDVGVSTQDLDTVYTEDVRGNIQTLHFQCANLVFCALDLMNVMSAEAKNKQPKIILSHRQQDCLKDFIKNLPKDKLALLASKCRSHARALCYFEQYLFENKNQLDRYATSLQRVYVALDDAFEAAGIEVARTTPTTLYDDIANHEASGRFDKASVCYDTLLHVQDDDVDMESYIDDALSCLSNQGDYQRLYDKSKQLISDHSNLKRNILPYAVEATANLGKWDELGTIFKKEPMDNLLESASVSQGYLLMSLNQSTIDARDRLKMVCHRLMKPLSIAMMDRSAYFRGYQNFLVLHSVGDFALTLDTFESEHMEPDLMDENTIDNFRVVSDRKMEYLLDIWDKRNKLVQPTLRSLEPLLVWQRSISLVLAKKYPCLKERTNVDVGYMWLKSADSAREVQSFDRSFFCLTQAKKWFGSKFDQLNLDLRVQYHIEQAKLNWEQGEQTKAIRGLKLSLERLRDHRLYKHLNSRRDQNESSETFPVLISENSCAECLRCSQTDRVSFAKLKMLLTQYCEEAAAGLPETLFFMYEECVHLGVNQEETYLRLARYYDKLLAYYMENPALCGNQTEEEKKEKNQFEPTQFSQSLMGGGKEDVYTNLMEHSIIAFGNSLKYGVSYIRESMPRLLNIWYDLGTKRHPGLRDISKRIENTIRFIDELKKSLPPYYFMTAISILLSRVSHPHSGVSKKTCEILELLLEKYPHQITWHLIALYNDNENGDRKRAARSILLSYKKKSSSKVEKIVKDTLIFSQVVNDLCKGPRDKKGDRSKLSGCPLMKDVCPLAMKFDFKRATVMIPIQASMRAIIPIDDSCGSPAEHQPFPEQNLSYITGFIPTLRVFNSLQQPICVTFQCNNGKNVNIIFKSGDDLRKDSRCTEFLDLLNRILRRDNQSNARFFEIQTFLVLPTESHAGIIEMVPNLETMRNLHETLYRERKGNFSMNDQLTKKRETYKTAKELHTAFINEVLPKVTPPVLPTWFLRTFTEPTSWYMARLAFTRTAAVSSMGGYIIGLGDRHLDNILINTRNGRLVHVDFNLLFHQGENLQVPERVPFRLTQNFVAAFGPMGTEGNFRKVCEIAMRVMRKEKDSLLTVLKPFMHDPCSEWTKSRDSTSKMPDRHAVNSLAKSKIEVVERKLKGFPRSKKFKPLTLIDSYSVEAQVDNLIEEAGDTFNLSHMYYGWCPHI